jgi:hypothetical protein
MKFSRFIHFSIVIPLFLCFIEVFGRNKKFHTNEWISFNEESSFPSNCHIGGFEKSDNFEGSTYIGRRHIDEEIVIGKVLKEWKAGYCK